MLLGFDRHDVRMAFNLARLGVRDRFLGSTLGLVWVIFNPVLMFGIFTFVFGFVFQSKLPGAETSLTFVVWLISGYGPWLAISEGLTYGTASVVSNSGIIKNLPFKTELLPIVGVLMGLIPLAVALVFLIVLLWVEGSMPSLPWLIIPFAIVFQVLFISGLGLFLAALNVFVRDVFLVLPNVLLLVLFASPIFYPIEAFPSVIRPLVLFNPFYVLTEAYRAPLIRYSLPPLWTLVYLVILAVLVFWAGLGFFRRLKSFFDSRL